MGKISGYTANTSPPSSFEFLGDDPTNTGMGPGGTTELVTLATILSKVPQATSSAYGTIKLSGTSTEYLNGAGAWTTPSGGSGGVPGMQVIWMDALGADSTGATSVTTIFNDQLTAAAGAPCVFVFGVGTYLWSTAPNSLGAGQSVIGWGKEVTGFTWAGSGPLFTVTTAAVSGTWNGSLNAGTFHGFSINGPYGTGGTAGIKYGALQGMRLDDIGFYGLDGTCVSGYQVTAGVDWAEEGIFTRLDVSGCGATSKAIFAFDTTSFDYTSIDCVVVVEANIDILALTNSAEMQGLKFGCRGNLHGNTTNTGAVVSLDRGNSAGQSYLTNAVFAVSMEGDDASAGGSGTVGHYMVWMGSANPASQFSGSGVLMNYNVGAPSQGWFNPNFLPASFEGITVAPNGGSMSSGAALAVIGGTRLTPIGDGFQAGTDLYWQIADVLTLLLGNGAQTLVFHGADAFIAKGELYLKEPASGTAPTVTWPAGVVWLSGGGTPSFTASGRTHKICWTYLPTETAYEMDYRGYHS